MRHDTLFWPILIWVVGMAIAFPITAHMVHRHGWSRETGVVVMLFWFLMLPVFLFLELLGFLATFFLGALESLTRLYAITEVLWDRKPPEKVAPDEPEPAPEPKPEDSKKEEEGLDPRVNTRPPKRGLPN